MADEKPAMSPTVNEVDHNKETMTFPEAMESVRKGQKVHRLEWEDEKKYGAMNDGRLTISNDKLERAPWLVSDGDINETDWVVTS